MSVSRETNLLTLLLAYIFPWVRDKSGTRRCSNGIFKRKLSKQKRADLMHIFIDIFLFSTKPGLQYAQCLYYHPPLRTMNDARENL